MKLLDLFENTRSTISRETYDLHLYIVVQKGFVGVESSPLFVSVVDVDVTDYDGFVNSAGDNIKSILDDVYSKVISEYNPNDGYISIQGFQLTDRLNDGGSTILIGKQHTIFNITREILISIEEPEEDIQNIIGKIKLRNLPTKEQCMTRLKRDDKLVRAVTRKYDIKDINIELTVTPKVSSVVNVILKSLPENMDEEKLGFELAKILKPYKIRPQINGGTIIGSRPL